MPYQHHWSIRVHQLSTFEHRKRANQWVQESKANFHSFPLFSKMLTHAPYSVTPFRNAECWPTSCVHTAFGILLQKQCDHSPDVCTHVHIVNTYFSNGSMNTRNLGIDREIEWFFLQARNRKMGCTASRICATSVKANILSSSNSKQEPVQIISMKKDYFWRLQLD